MPKSVYLSGIEKPLKEVQEEEGDQKNSGSMWKVKVYIREGESSEVQERFISSGMLLNLKL